MDGVPSHDDALVVHPVGVGREGHGFGSVDDAIFILGFFLGKRPGLAIGTLEEGDVEHHQDGEHNDAKFDILLGEKNDKQQQEQNADCCKVVMDGVESF